MTSSLILPNSHNKESLYTETYKYAQDIIKDLSIKEPPLPTDRVLNHLGLKLNEYSYSYYDPMGQLYDLDPDPVCWLKWDTNTIYIHKNTNHGLKRTSIFHECGHKHIPTHTGISYFCSEQDLSIIAKKQYEKEAFEYAAELLMPRQFLLNDIMNLDISFKSIKKIQKKYDTSFELAAIRFSKFNFQKCCLIVADFIKPKNTTLSPYDINYPLKVRYCVPSKTFPLYFKSGTSINPFSSVYKFCFSSVYSRTRTTLEKEISLIQLGSVKYNFSAYFKYIKRTLGTYILVRIPDNNLTLF